MKFNKKLIICASLITACSSLAVAGKSKVIKFILPEGTKITKGGSLDDFEDLPGIEVKHTIEFPAGATFGDIQTLGNSKVKTSPFMDLVQKESKAANTTSGIKDQPPIGMDKSGFSVPSSLIDDVVPVKSFDNTLFDWLTKAEKNPSAVKYKMLKGESKEGGFVPLAKSLVSWFRGAELISVAPRGGISELPTLAFLRFNRTTNNPVDNGMDLMFGEVNRPIQDFKVNIINPSSSQVDEIKKNIDSHLSSLSGQLEAGKLDVNVTEYLEQVDDVLVSSINFRVTSDQNLLISETIVRQIKALLDSTMGL